MSRSHGRATAQDFPDFAQNLEICMQKLKNYSFKPLLPFFFMIHTYYAIFGLILALFLAQKCKN